MNRLSSYFFRYFLCFFPLAFCVSYTPACMHTYIHKRHCCVHARCMFRIVIITFIVGNNVNKVCNKREVEEILLAEIKMVWRDKWSLSRLDCYLIHLISWSFFITHKYFCVSNFHWVTESIFRVIFRSLYNTKLCGIFPTDMEKWHPTLFWEINFLWSALTFCGFVLPGPTHNPVH